MGAARTPLPWTSRPAASTNVSFSTSPTRRLVMARMSRTFIPATTIPPIGHSDNHPDVVRRTESAPRRQGVHRRSKERRDLGLRYPCDETQDLDTGCLGLGDARPVFIRKKKEDAV